MTNDRYESPVAGLGEEALAVALRQSIEDVQRRFPEKTGICVFVFDIGKGGGMGYIANAERGTMVAAMREWIRHQLQQS